MIEVKEATQCTACGSCQAVCPQKIIKMEYDGEGFAYPKVDLSKCTNCGLCTKSCHMLRTPAAGDTNPERYYAGFLKDTEMLSEVSSGGAFWALAQTIIGNQGIVYGAVQDAPFHVYHGRAADLKECEKFRRSKYLESNLEASFQWLKEDLKDGKTVLFTGTGCQVAGIYSFLGERPSRLITCEVVCHGVPSLKAYQKYVEELETEKGSKLTRVVFRDKTQGWKKNSIAMYFTDETVIREQGGSNSFHDGYVHGLYYRPSCGKCRYARLPRVADITLADFWKYSGALKTFNEDRGISLIVCSTEAGNLLFEAAQKFLHWEAVEKEQAINSSRHLTKPPTVHVNRPLFFKLLDKKGYSAAKTAALRRRSYLKKAVRKLQMLKGNIYGN